MSKLEKLIQQLCPDGVEYKQMGEVCLLKAGNGIVSSKIAKNQDNLFKFSTDTC